MTNLKKTNINGYVKSDDTGIVTSTDSSELQAYKKRKLMFNKIDILEHRILKLEKEMEELKNGNNIKKNI